MGKVSIYGQLREMADSSSEVRICYLCSRGCYISSKSLLKKTIKSDEVKNRVGMSNENTTEKMKSEENGSSDGKNNGDSSDSQATTETNQNEDICWSKITQTVTKKRNELDCYMADANEVR